MARIIGVSIQFTCENAAFDNFDEEIAYLGRQIQSKLTLHNWSESGEWMKLRDSNGNTVGRITVELEEEDDGM